MCGMDPVRFENLENGPRWGAPHGCLQKYDASELTQLVSHGTFSVVAKLHIGPKCP